MLIIESREETIVMIHDTADDSGLTDSIGSHFADKKMRFWIMNF